MVAEQSDRMLSIVESELRKLSFVEQNLSSSVFETPVKPVIERIISAYRLLPRPTQSSGSLAFKVSVRPEHAVFPGSLQDLQDLYGTLLENAMRFAEHVIHTSVTSSSDNGAVDWILVVEDDGSGFSEEQLSDFVGASEQALASSDGFGLGLGIVREIVRHYNGQIIFDRSALGGARIKISL